VYIFFFKKRLATRMGVYRRRCVFNFYLAFLVLFGCFYGWCGFFSWQAGNPGFSSFAFSCM